MDPGGDYSSPNLEHQLRHMIMNRGLSQKSQVDPRMQQHQHPSLDLRSPPGLGPTQQHYSSNVPLHRQQDFSHFLQQHHVTPPMPLPPHRAPPNNNNFRPHGPQHHQNPHPMDPDVFNRPPPRGPSSHQGYPQHPNQNQQQPRHLYQPQTPYQQFHTFSHERQVSFLESLAMQEISKTRMSDSEIELKDAFRVKLQRIFENLTSPDPEQPLPSVQLASFGSLSSGFATAGSDMDLAIVTSDEHDLSQRFSPHETGLARVLEKELLDNGIGARLLTRTRVPIIKICEKPTPELLSALRESREKWDHLPEDEKYATSKPSADDSTPKKDTSATEQPSDEPGLDAHSTTPPTGNGVAPQATQSADPVSSLVQSTQALKLDQTSPDQVTSKLENAEQPQQPIADKQANRQRNDKIWKREKAVGPLDFPKDGVGIQCDINFFNPLGIYNTQMLRCYSKCDPRVRLMVLFIKSWAKRRKINSSYSGTLSSYGYVLMVLHYLVNVAQPPVLPNLQHEAEANDLPTVTVDGYEVRFFDREDLIESRASAGAVTQNDESVGKLLVGFFKYYAVNAGGFFWTRDVLSLRSPGGFLSKDEKGWTGAKTEVGENKEVRHRYLFAIEDPFETTHNVARTVTHNGICAIRDEFRRAWRIIGAVGRRGGQPEGGLFDELTEAEERPQQSAASKAPPPTAHKAQAYGQQFPTLAGGPAAGGSQRAPSQVAQMAPVPTSNVVQPAVQAQPEGVPTAARGKGRRQKFVPLNL